MLVMSEAGDSESSELYTLELLPVIYEDFHAQRRMGMANSPLENIHAVKCSYVPRHVLWW